MTDDNAIATGKHNDKWCQTNIPVVRVAHEQVGTDICWIRLLFSLLSSELIHQDPLRLLQWWRQLIYQCETTIRD